MVIYGIFITDEDTRRKTGGENKGKNRRDEENVNSYAEEQGKKLRKDRFFTGRLDIS